MSDLSRQRAPRRMSLEIMLLATMVATLFAACSNGKSDVEAPSVTASPAGGTFPTSTTVTLTAMDDRDPSPTIHYTLDATEPTLMSPVYSGPLVLTATTILKFFAVDDQGKTSPTNTVGYKRASGELLLEWAASGHGDITAEAFRRWDEDGVVQTSCAKCHSGGGYIDFLADGVVDAPAALPLGHDCDTCHAAAPDTRYDDLVAHPQLEPVAFPSEDTASFWGASNLCTSCHQGRNSTLQVDEAIAEDPGGPYRFINIHYYPAAASYFGSEVQGGYQYDGMEYVGRNVFGSHDVEQQDCVGCHMRGADKDHRFEPQVADCTSCHMGTSFEDLSGSPSINHDAIEVSHAQLLAVIRTYASDVLGEAIAYSSSSYPYFFADANDNGIGDPGEGRYELFDEKLLKAAFNYQMVAKDPAGFIHNGTYLRQLLHDSIVDLGGNPYVEAPGRDGFDEEGATKAEQWHISGHADSTGEPFRHWDFDDGESTGLISSSCVRCHSSQGFVDYVADGAVDGPPVLATGVVGCATCHGDNNLFADSSTRHDDLVTNTALEPVGFPSDEMATLSDNSNICMTCHQGRESGKSVDDAIMDPGPYSFINRHYYAAGALYFGSEVNAAYEYAGRTYDGMVSFPVEHAGRTTCVGCHMGETQDHTFEVKIDDCSVCHVGITEFEELGAAFGMANTDYDGDGMGESFQGEIDGMAEQLLLEIQAYAATTLMEPIIYVPTSYPYWFKDTGVVNYGTRYTDFDATLLKAVFNYHAAQDPCGDIHNHRYVLQTLYDSIDDLDGGGLDNSPMGTMGLMTRP